jgi:TRAP-type C4-dicarboxylate transport system permease small subunit
MAKWIGKLGGWTTVAVAVPMLVFLGGAAWFAVSGWSSTSGTTMPTAGYVAMILGIVFSLVVGCGLMTLVFYSSRYGYDEQPHRVDEDHD